MVGSIVSDVCPSQTFADLTDVTLADEDNISILTGDAIRTILGNVAMQVAPSGGKSCS